MTKTRLLPVMALALTLLLPGPAADQAILEEAVEEISGPGGDDSE
jgi:hypothetical protein